MKITVDHIQPGRLNRPNTNPASSLYKKVIRPEWIVIHNPASPGWNAKRLHEYGKAQYTRPGLKSWNYSVDKDSIYEMIPVGEASWQAGDNLGEGNTNSISMEICDRGAYVRDWGLFWADMANGARLCAYLIKTVPSLRPYPECLTQHNKWSGKNCPYWIRREPGGWERFVNTVGGYLKEPTEPLPETPLPEIQRIIGIELNGNRVDEVGYLINNSTYVKVSYLARRIAGLGVTGHGDHIRITTK